MCLTNIMKTSYSLPLWHNLEISTDLFLKEMDYALFDFTDLSEWMKIKEWIDLIYVWRHNNLRYQLTSRQLIGIYGELLAAGLLIKNTRHFEEWLFTAAIVGKGGNTNKDLRNYWLGEDITQNLEVKTISSTNSKIWGSDEKRAYIIPAGLIAVKEINETTYYIHSVTANKDLQKICETIRQPHEDHNLYLFELDKLNKVKWDNSRKFMEYMMNSQVDDLI